MTIADVHFAIGKTHKVCEDYAESGAIWLSSEPMTAQALLDNPDLVRRFAIVADGCSSSPNTDFGARLLVRAAISEFDECNDQEDDPLLRPTAIILKANEWRRSLDLPSTSLDATLVVVVENGDHNAEVFLAGDGVIAARRRDGSGIDYWVVECSHNAPTYLSYLLEPQSDEEPRLKALQNFGGGVRTVEHYAPDRDTIREEDRFWATLLTDEQDDSESYALHWTFDREAYDVVVGMTDGVQSFQRRVDTRFERVPLDEVLSHIMSFKQTTTGFVQRRVGRFLSKHCIKNDWSHTDDLAVAGMALDEASEDEQNMLRDLWETP